MTQQIRKNSRQLDGFSIKRNTYYPQKPALTRYFEDMFGRTCNW